MQIYVHPMANANRDNPIRYNRMRLHDGTNYIGEINLDSNSKRWDTTINGVFVGSYHSLTAALNDVKAYIYIFDIDAEIEFVHAEPIEYNTETPIHLDEHNETTGE